MALLLHVAASRVRLNGIPHELPVADRSRWHGVVKTWPWSFPCLIKPEAGTPHIYRQKPSIGACRLWPGASRSISNRSLPESSEQAYVGKSHEVHNGQRTLGRLAHRSTADTLPGLRCSAGMPALVERS